MSERTRVDEMLERLRVQGIELPAAGTLEESLLIFEITGMLLDSRILVWETVLTNRERDAKAAQDD